VIYWITFVFVAATFFFLRWLLTSRYGVMLRATRDGENRVRFLGHNPLPYKVVAFGIAGGLAGIGGALFTLHSGVVSPALVGVVPSIEMVVWVAVGGRNILWGAIAGTLLVNFAKDQISSAFPSLWLYGLGALFILAVSFLPAGIAGLFRPGSGEERVMRRILSRRKLSTAE
jgi:urea transport system permease protein